MRIEETEWKSWVRHSTGNVENEDMIEVKRHPTPGKVKVFHPKHNRSDPVEGTVTGDTINFTIDHKVTHRPRRYSGPVVPGILSARIDGTFEDGIERGDWIARIRYDWGSTATPDSTGEIEDDVITTIEQLAPGAVNVFHPRHKDYPDPVPGTISGNDIRFTIDHADGGGTSHRRLYQGTARATANGAEIPDGRYHGLDIFLTEQSSEYEQDKKAHKRRDGDDGGWVATRPPT